MNDHVRQEFFPCQETDQSTRGPGADPFPRTIPDGRERKLVEAVVSALSATGHSPLREITVAVNRETVILEGNVPTYYQKQLAQEVVQRLGSGCRVFNDIEVVSRSADLPPP
jgi:hypothetical protein